MWLVLYRNVVHCQDRNPHHLSKTSKISIFTDTAPRIIPHTYLDPLHLFLLAYSSTRLLVYSSSRLLVYLSSRLLPSPSLCIVFLSSCLLVYSSTRLLPYPTSPLLPSSSTCLLAFSPPRLLDYLTTVCLSFFSTSSLLLFFTTLQFHIPVNSPLADSQ